MSMSDATENDVLKMMLKGVDPSWRAGATQYLALVSLASPLESAPIASELDYTGYERVPVTKATAWTDNGSSFANAALTQWGKRTDAGATQTARSVVIVDTVSGAIGMGIIAAIATPINIDQNIQPQAEAGDITVTAE